LNSAPVSGKVQEAKLEEWIKSYGDAVLRTCFVCLQDRTLAEDAMQDTFIKAWRSMAKYEGRNGSNEKTWLLRIAINTCKDYRRTAWFRHVDLSRAFKDLPPALRAVTDESRAMFMDVLRLPAALQQVVLLYHFHNMTLAEAAQVLHIGRSTVQHRLRKAYELLRFVPERSDCDE
jgi:RNA polymerase sigma-70 factor, ECF subfamily